MGAAEEFLAGSCSTLQYLHDRGEIDQRLQGVLTHVRYTGTTEIDRYEVIWNGRVVRVTAEDAGPHTCTPGPHGYCPDCLTETGG